MDSICTSFHYHMKIKWYKEGEGMSKRGEPIAMALPYKSFKQKIALINKYLGKYRIEDLGGILYMERRGN